MKLSTCFPSKFLKAGDIPPGRDVSAVIDGVTVESMQEGSGEDKPVLYFVGKTKGLVLNKTNSDAIAAVLGDETDDWHGKTVILFSTTTQFQGRATPCIRIRVPQQPAKAPLPNVNAMLQEAAAEAQSADLPF